VHNLNGDDDDHYDKTPSPPHTFNIKSYRFTQTTSLHKCNTSNKYRKTHDQKVARAHKYGNLIITL